MEIYDAIFKMSGNATKSRMQASVIDLYGISNVAEYLGQVMHESSRLRITRENLNYAADKLIQNFGRHRISVDSAIRYGRIDKHVRARTGWTYPNQPANPVEIANRIYGGEFGRKNLGNVEPGDGWRFSGHGDIQLTGRANHRRFAEFIGEDRIMEEPVIVADDPYLAAHASAWFWVHHKRLNGVTNLRDITRAVTGSPTHALDEREALTAEADRLLRS